MTEQRFKHKSHSEAYGVQYSLSGLGTTQGGAEREAVMLGEFFPCASHLHKEGFSPGYSPLPRWGKLSLLPCVLLVLIHQHRQKEDECCKCPVQCRMAGFHAGPAKSSDCPSCSAGCPCWTSS